MVFVARGSRELTGDLESHLLSWLPVPSPASDTTEGSDKANREPEICSEENLTRVVAAAHSSDCSASVNGLFGTHLDLG